MKDEKRRKCARCLRLIRGKECVCLGESCQQVLCVNCAELLYCVEHEPTVAEQMAAAESAYRAGALPAFVTRLEAVRRGQNFLDRCGAKLTGAGLTRTWVSEWEWGYDRPKRWREPRLSINVRVLAQWDRLDELGYDTQPFDAAFLQPYLREIAAGLSEPLVLALAAPTGWEEDARALLVGDGLGDGWAQRWLHPILIDLRDGSVVCNPYDELAIAYRDHFRLATMQEMCAAIRAYLAVHLNPQHNVTKAEILAALGVTAAAVDVVFEEMAGLAGVIVEKHDGEVIVGVIGAG